MNWLDGCVIGLVLGWSSQYWYEWYLQGYLAYTNWMIRRLKRQIAEIKQADLLTGGPPQA
jgi:hypothetical protein